MVRAEVILDQAFLKQVEIKVCKKIEDSFTEYGKTFTEKTACIRYDNDENCAEEGVLQNHVATFECELRHQSPARIGVLTDFYAYGMNASPISTPSHMRTALVKFKATASCLFHRNELSTWTCNYGDLRHAYNGHGYNQLGLKYRGENDRLTIPNTTLQSDFKDIISLALSSEI